MSVLTLVQDDRQRVTGELDAAVRRSSPNFAVFDLEVLVDAAEAIHGRS